MDQRRHLTAVKAEPSITTDLKPRAQEDPKWMAVTVQEQALIAHVRGWCHHGPTCALCLAQNTAVMAEREAAALRDRRDGQRRLHMLLGDPL